MAKKPATDRFVKVTSLVFDSPAFRTLPGTSHKLWFDLRTQFFGCNNGNISAALSTLRRRGWRHPETLSRALWTLLERGLLRRIREGKPGPLRLCALFAFTDLPVARNDRLDIEGGPATLEFARWVPGMSFAPESKARKLPSNPIREKTPIRKSNRQRFDDRSVTAHKNEALRVSTDTKNEAVISDGDRLKPAPALASESIAH